MSEQKAKKWDLRYVHHAEHISTWSKDPSTQTGAVIVAPDRTIVSLGYNGFPRGMEDTPERLNDRQEKYARIIHCEMNALLSSRLPVEGCVLFTWPFLSCSRCAVHVAQAGIMRCVAPRVPSHLLDRWGDELERTRSYYEEIGVAYTELDLKNSTVHREFYPDLGISAVIEELTSGE